MNRDKSTRVRRHSRHNNARNDNISTNEDDSESSAESERQDEPKSTSTPLRRNRTISGSSVKSSRRHSESKPLEDSDNEIVPSDATYSKYDSGSNKNNVESPVDSVKKDEDFLMSDYMRNKEKRESDSPDNNPVAKREKRRKSKKQRSEKNRTLIQDRTEDDENGRSSDRDLSRPRVKKTQENIPRKSRRRRRRSKGDSSGKTEIQEKELPITEILRKAQENLRPRYEDPAPLTELTTDRIYVQGRNGFSAVKISNDRSGGILGRRRSESREPSTPLYPIKVAIIAQKIWNSTGFIYQGLLAGIALMHFILIQTFFQLSHDFIVNYSLVSEYYANIFSFLVTMCIISAFDRFDLAQLDIEHLREIYVEHARSFLAIPLYIATFCLHQTSLLIDYNMSLLSYSRNATMIDDNNSTGIVVEEDLGTWQRVILAKDSMAVLAWLFVALGPREDMLLTHLKAMEKYAEPPETSE